MAMAARSQSPRNAPRGPAAGRRGGRGGSGLRPDRDGDVTMDIAVKGRGRVGKSTPPPTPGRDLSSRVSRGGGSRGGGRGSLLSDKSRSAIARHVASNDVSMREPRTSAPRAGLVELKITGWEKSKASGDADGGVSSLIRWMEKKASHRLGSRTREVKIKKVCRHQVPVDRRALYCQLAAIISGPPSFAANFRTTTAIQEFGPRVPYG